MAAALLAAAGLYLAYDARFYPHPPPARYPRPGNALDAQQQDLDYYRKLVAMDRAFGPEARAEAGRRLDALAASSTTLGPDHLRVALLRIAALADNGHTAVFSDARRGGLPRLLPIRVSDFADGFYVMQTEPANADLLGARVVAIDGLPVDEVVARLETLRGGTPAFRRQYAGRVLNAADNLHGLDVSPTAERSTWSFALKDGSTAERTFDSYRPGPGEPLPSSWRVRSPEPIPGDRVWQAFKAAPLPVTYRSPDRTFRALTIPSTCFALVQLKANDDVGAEHIKDFLRRTESHLRTQKPCAVIFDLRQDGGGDYTTTAAFAAALPGLLSPRARVYVLTGPATFSAGITTAVFTKQADPSRVMLLGEPAGDRLAFWSEGGSGCLPNAPLCFHFTTGRHDYGHDCTDWRTCFWLNWIYPARVDTLQPEETIPTTFTAYANGHDPVLERALELMDSAIGER